MNLQQIRYVCEIAKRDLNISAVAAALHTSQSGISKQVKALEEELSFEIFRRSKSRLLGITPEGERIIAMAQNILGEVANMKALSADLHGDAAAPLVIAVTHTQARYVLPEAIRRFAKSHPAVQVSMRHANPEKVVSMLIAGEAEIGVTADEPEETRQISVFPYRSFRKLVVVPRGHALLKVKRLSLEAISRYPLVTYESGFVSRRHLIEAFEARGIRPTISVSAIDADVIKVCVEKGLGVAVLSEAVFDASKDAPLRAIPAGHLFAPSTTKILVSREHYQRQCARDFVELFKGR